MLPKKLHIEQIERFHSKMDELNTEIDRCKDREDLKDHLGKLLMQYYKLGKVWVKIDNMIEMTIKHEIDCMEDEPN